MIYINSKLTVNTTIDMLIICDIIYIIMLEVVEEVERKQVFFSKIFLLHVFIRKSNNFWFTIIVIFQLQ